MTVRVLLVDDHASMRAGLAMVLASDPGIEVVGEAGDGAQAVQVARERRPDLVFMDVEMPGWNGVLTTTELLRVLPEVRILVLTMFDLDEYVAGAMQAGAHGFLLKTADAQELIAAVHACAAGEAVLTPEILSRVAAHFVRSHVVRPREGIDRLTEREREVLVEVSRGANNTEIGQRLYMAEGTVKTHIGRLLSKLRARDRVGLVLIAHECGLLDD